MNEIVIKAADLREGMLVRRSAPVGGYTLSPAVSVAEPRTLNDGKTVVISVSYGGGQGATFYATEDVTIGVEDPEVHFTADGKTAWCSYGSKAEENMTPLSTQATCSDCARMTGRY